jgi:hypothetical protein
MRSWLTVFCCLLLIASGAWAQSDRGTITGTITDTSDAILPGAPVEAENIETGAVYQAISTDTGVYTLAQLPVGTYQISTSVEGFKKFVQTGITVMVAQTLRIDIQLEVGGVEDVITVTADAPLLQTESAELSHNIPRERLDELPMLSAVGMRDPFAAVNLMPGTAGTGAGAMRINGMPGFTMSLRIDGQDATQNIWTNAYGMSIPSVDSVEETAVQTSSFAAEYGQAGGGILNMTMRSGTNQLHGSLFEYFRNEALNAYPPYKKSPEYAKPRDRQHDWGFNLGGPVYIPNMYDGRNKTFFFYSFEQNRLKNTSNGTYTFPTADFQNGDFSALLGEVIGTNPETGEDILAGTIYDPSTTHTINVGGTDYVVRDPFMGCDGESLNVICMDTAPIDPVALRYQSYFPSLTRDSLINNYDVSWPAKNVTTIQAFKIDHYVSPKLKLTGYYSLNDVTVGTFDDGLEVPLSTGRFFKERTHTIRVSADYTISPTKLLSVGAGVMHFIFKDPQENVNWDNLENLDLPGTFGTFAPTINMDTSQGGFGSGTVAYSATHQIKPTATASLAWVKGNHNLKFGGELRVESHPSTVYTPANGAFYFNAAETSMPYLFGSGGTGHPYASFLLGMFHNGEIGVPNRFHLGKHSFAFYVQDSWKVTPKLTLDYGLRWDYQTMLQETEGRMPSWDPDLPNPSYGNIPGAPIFKKDLADIYPHAWGPRLGVAYQFMEKTVLRGGIGITYGQTGALEMWNLRMGSFVRYGPNATWSEPIGLFEDGPNIGGTPVVPIWPNRDPGQAPAAEGSDIMPWISPGAGRPPRQIMWSIAIQREITPNLSVDVSYVGNRGAWWNANGAITDPNRVTPETLAEHNFDLSNFDDRALLLTPLSSVIGTQDAIDHNLSMPYAGFGGAVNQSLRPFPHVGNIFMLWAPLGRTWYDSLQVNVTKRSSFGLDFTAAYTWQKELTIGVETNDTAFNIAPAVNNINDFKSNKTISGYSVPHRLVIGANYRVPVIYNDNKYLSWALRDWTIGAMLTYASGMPIMAPRATSSEPGHDIGTLLKLCSAMGVLGGCNGSLFMGNSPASYASRVEGEPVFLVDPNSSFDPLTEILLNANAWEAPPDGQYGTGSPYYGDYRYRRRPSENMSLGRIFPIQEGVELSLRIELMNIFNRVQIPNPGIDFYSNNATAPTFGLISGAINAGGQRTGQIVARLKF